MLAGAATPTSHTTRPAPAQTTRPDTPADSLEPDMSLSVALGLVLALLTAFGSVAGFLYKFRGARSAPPVELRRPIRSTILLFRSPVYLLGIAIGLSSWLVHVGALALAPISLAQATVAGGLVLLTVVADQLFGIEVTRREWIGVTLMAAGLAALAATLDGDARSAHSHYAVGTLTVFLLATAGGGLLVTALFSRRASALALAAGFSGRPRTRRSRPLAGTSTRLARGCSCTRSRWSSSSPRWWGC